MANPRNTVRFDEIDVVYVTFAADPTTIPFDATKAGGSVVALSNLAVTMLSNSTVALCAAGDVVIGQLVKVEADGKATIATAGYIPFKSQSAPTLGLPIIGALGPGSVKGYVTMVAAADPKGRGNTIDNSDLNNVWVHLD